jgi:hypothetical protein
MAEAFAIAAPSEKKSKDVHRLAIKDLTSFRNRAMNVCEARFGRKEMTNRNATSEAIETRKFGIEIEVEGLTREQAKQQIAFPRGWHVVTDGSLCGGCEVTSPPMTLRKFGNVEYTMEKLMEESAKISKRCSIHVHVDAGDFDLEAMKRLVENTRAYEPWIYQIARGGDTAHRGKGPDSYHYCQPIEQVHRSDETDYNKLIKAKSFQEFWEQWYRVPRQELPYIFSQKYNRTRYRGLNLHSYNYRGTIEFRYFDGTLNPRDVKAWVILCLRLVERSLNKRTVLRGVKVMDTGRNPLYRLATGLGLTDEERRLFQHHKLAWQGI